jgi:hypothetical protein
MVLIFIFQLVPFNVLTVFAEDQPMPTQFAVDIVDGKPAIGYSTSLGNYVSFKWTSPAWRGDVQYYQLFYAAYGEMYNQYDGTITSDQTTVTLDHLDSGKVYTAYLVAVHDHLLGGSVASRHMSNRSDVVTFLTNIDISISPTDNNQIELQWNDVYYQSKRIQYNLYISESSLFAQTPALAIKDNNIGTIVKPVDGKLVYESTNLKPGTLYYVKIKPVFEDDVVKHAEESLVKVGFTYILGRMSKVSSDWWRLEWNEITSSNLGQNQEIIYKIVRSINGGLEEEISATKDNQIFIKSSTENVYYRINCQVLVENQTIDMTSQMIYTNETEIPVTPIVPEVVDQLDDQTMVTNPTSVKILWKAPTTADGGLDSNVVYDIWMLTSSDDINNAEITPTVSNLKVTSDNYIYQTVGGNKTTKVVGYNYVLDQLLPNKIYYLKMVAKKSFVINEGGTLSNKSFSSEAALKVIITPISGSIEQPVVPAKPPFKIKTELVSGVSHQMIASDGVTLTWKNKWAEVWSDVYSQWQYVTTDELEELTVQGAVYRILDYDKDVKFSVGYEVYTDNFDFTRLSEKTGQMATQFTDIPNNLTGEDVDYQITNLQPNTTYVVWLRAYRNNIIKSGLSDPIIFTTLPSSSEPNTNPPIPVINYKIEGDTSLELGWTVNRNYTYSISYWITEDLSAAKNTITLTPEQMRSKNSYTFTKLNPDTNYFFWIRAYYVDSKGNQYSSDWSDAYIAKTKPYMPPDAPVGLGLKTDDNPTGKDYLIFEWIKLDGLQYNLEIARKEDFSDKKVYSVGAVSDYKIQNLESNTRYYIRLSAFDSNKQLSSAYSAVISTKTARSNDEYYTDTDSQYITPAKPALNTDKVGIYDLSNQQVDIAIKQITADSGTTYLVDYSGLTTDKLYKSKTTVSPRIFTALLQNKKTMTIDNGDASLVIKPEMAKNSQLRKLHEDDSQAQEAITFEQISSSNLVPASGMSFVSSAWRITLEVNTNGINVPLKQFDNMAGVKIAYTSSTWYDKSTMSGYIYDETTKKWQKVNTTNFFDTTNSSGWVYSSIPRNADFAIMKTSAGTTDNQVANGDQDIKKGEAVKLLLSLVGYNNNQNYLQAAEKSKITQYIDMSSLDSLLTRQEAAAMVTRIYELKSQKSVNIDYSLSGILDKNLIKINLLPRLRFAIKNGILGKDGSNRVRPNDSLTKLELIEMNRRMTDLMEE